jgi:sugar transferase (PEP-CTERM/EpsH1 system associated)
MMHFSSGTHIGRANASITSTDNNPPPLVLHIIYRLAVGGLENGLVNLINYMPSESYRHAIACLTDYTDFRDRIQRPDVPVIALHKREGHDFSVHVRLWQVLRRLRPAIVHTRNLPGLEYAIPSTLAGIPGRIHGEHGRDMYDLDGSNVKYNLLRKAIRPLVHGYTTVSIDLANWLVHTVGARAERVKQIYNGVDTQRFHPRTGARASLGPEGFASPRTLVVGTVGRMEAVKDQLTLVRAFIHLLNTEPRERERLRLVVIGDGSLRAEARKLLRVANADHLAWLPGERGDIPEIMRALDVFVLPSLREGISNTILEAMASGLPVVATRIGGNPELVDEEHTGMLVPYANPVAMAAAIRTYLVERDRLIRHGQAGREKAETRFSMEAMIDGYLAAYDAVLHSKRSRYIRARFNVPFGR